MEKTINLGLKMKNREGKGKNNRKINFVNMKGLEKYIEKEKIGPLKRKYRNQAYKWKIERKIRIIENKPCKYIDN